MLFKRLSLAVLITAVSQAAMASPATSTLQFAGAVKGSTCDIELAGVEAPNQVTIALPDVQASRLVKSGDTDGLTRFTLVARNCSSVDMVNVRFRAAPGTTTSWGWLNNMAADNPAKNVRLEIGSDFGGSYSKMWVNDQEDKDPQNSLGSGVTAVWNSTSFPLGVRYFATGPVTEGNVEAAAECIVWYE